jgi:hypothetical protein
MQPFKQISNKRNTEFRAQPRKLTIQILIDMVLRIYSICYFLLNKPILFLLIYEDLSVITSQV